VVPSNHSSRLDLCVENSMTNLAHYEHDRQLIQAIPTALPTQPWAKLLDTGTQQQFNARGNRWWYKGTQPANLVSKARRFGFAESVIPSTPTGFRDMLQRSGPFMYVGTLTSAPRDLLGRRPGHSVVVTGMERRGDMHYVHYNDPSDGKAHLDEFYGFLRKLLPVGAQSSSVVFNIARPQGVGPR
jgi:hypothetical protein